MYKRSKVILTVISHDAVQETLQNNQNLGAEREKVKMMAMLDVCGNLDVLFSNIYIWSKV